MVYDLFVMYLLKKVEFFELVSFMFVLVFVDFVEDYIFFNKYIMGKLYINFYNNVKKIIYLYEMMGLLFGFIYGVGYF